MSKDVRVQVPSTAPKLFKVVFSLSKIEICFKSGECVIWDGRDGFCWDDYSFDGNAFIVKHQGAWVGIYNFSVIASIHVY